MQDQYQKLIAIQTRKEKDFKTGDTPIETLMYLHTSNVVQDHEQRISDLESKESQLDAEQKQKELQKELQKEIEQQKKAIRQLEDKIYQLQTGHTPTDYDRYKMSLSSKKRTSSPIMCTYKQKEDNMKSFYLYHYGVPYNPADSRNYLR